MRTPLNCLKILNSIMNNYCNPSRIKNLSRVGNDTMIRRHYLKIKCAQIVYHRYDSFEFQYCKTNTSWVTFLNSYFQRQNSFLISSGRAFRWLYFLRTELSLCFENNYLCFWEKFEIKTWPKPEFKNYLNEFTNKTLFLKINKMEY